MGAKQSSEKPLSLAEKRYRVASPRNRRRSQKDRNDPSARLRTAVSLSDRTSSTERPNPRIVHSNSADGPTAKAETPDAAHEFGPDNYGSRVFLLVLTAEPDVKLSFGLEKIPPGRLRYHPLFRKHSLLIQKTIGFAINNIGHPSKLASHFESLGKRHYSNRGLELRYFDVFALSMMSACEAGEEGRKCRETMKAWKIVVDFIVRHMRIGFERETALRKRFAFTSTVASSSSPFVFPARSQTLSSTQRQSSHPRLNEAPSLPSPSPSHRLDRNKAGLTPPLPRGPERTVSWTGERADLVEHLSRLRMSTSERNTTRERENSPQSSDYFTPPSSRRHQPDDFEKRLHGSLAARLMT
ncbi:Globin-like protein 9 [Aphelenchoides fujianensis]|nr:Globin-like protein 9 [Aphelenchoides fujianensis]